MDLLGQVCRSDRTGVNVQSNKDKRTLMMLASLANVLSLHKSHVGAERERLSEAGSRASPTDLGVADDTIKVGDLGWVADLAQRYWSARQREVVDQNAEGCRAAGNRLRLWRADLTMSQFRKAEPGTQSQSEGTCCPL